MINSDVMLSRYRTVVVVSVSPPIPAAQRIDRVGDGINALWVDDDDVVQLANLVITSVTSKLLAETFPADERKNGRY